jgi:hypothetical protein
VTRHVSPPPAFLKPCLQAKLLSRCRLVVCMSSTKSLTLREARFDLTSLRPSVLQCWLFAAAVDFTMPGGLHPPIAVILGWATKVNYVDPPSRGWSIVILCTVLLSCTYIVVGLRIWARFGLAKNGGIDDALIIFNMVRGPSFDMLFIY